ncbi:MAG: hypothetical protein JRF27_01680 [Deltaproteobacteria bacterium]|nr:hypothetical protein [Deltaproteobacteria bacterium]
MANTISDHILTGMFVLATVVMMSGCGGSTSQDLEKEFKQVEEKIHKIETELDRANAGILSAHAENERLSGDVVRLLNAAQKLRLENQLLSRRNREFKEWTRKLSDGYGPGIWYMDESVLPVFVQPVPSGDVADIAEELNRRFEKDTLPKILIKKIENQKVYVGVNDEEMLTQRLGSHGAESFLNTVIYSVGSVNGIDCVWFEFKEGDHAVPGEYCK